MAQVNIQEKLAEISDRACDLTRFDCVTPDAHKVLCNDVMFLVQVVEQQRNELYFRELAPIAKDLLARFAQLSPEQKMLMLELMREMRGKNDVKE